MQEFTTPMMKQYKKIKQEYQDCLLFYRLGDFYELFMDDAYIGAQVLDITLTGRPRGKDGRIPMAGVPYHAVDSYLSKLVKAGYKVAICEQMSLPDNKGIVDREVVRIVTPGTVLDEKALDKKTNNYIVSLTLDQNFLGISAADISTGSFLTIQHQLGDLHQILKDELSKLSPVECILPEELYQNGEILKTLSIEKNLNIYPFPEWKEYANEATQFLKDHFKIGSLQAFGIEGKPLLIESSAALLGYLQNTQKDKVAHIQKIVTLSPTDHLMMDRSTIINLELFSTIREHASEGTLLQVMDETVTAMGGRMLKDWLRKPLTSKDKIEERFEAVENLLSNHELREALRKSLKEVSDIERVLSRLSVGIGNARDLVTLKLSLSTILGIKQLLLNLTSPLIQSLTQQISPNLLNIVSLIEESIVDEPPFDLKGGNLIKSDLHPKLDELRDKVRHSKSWITKLETEERAKTGIASLKVRFNQVFGFYIEVSKSYLHLVPDYYIRRQTLVNGERFITPELKQQEEIILTAEETINDLEYQLFQTVLKQVLSQTPLLQQAAESIAQIDTLSNFANISYKYQYNRPKLIYSGEIKIKNGRHPVVERLLENREFVPNDILLDPRTQQLLLITGPNMAGKSVLIRQVALIVLIAQIGCFVPAQSAYISLVDRIFVRSGASDVITSGLSTFMVEMVETAHILHHATQNSLIIMDEIGRGTSTYDGISIAWAVAEFLVNNQASNPKTLFATHYHELQSLENLFPNKIKNYHLAVERSQGAPIFLHTLMRGGASSSFGVAVAKLAGVPVEVVERAVELLQQLEKRNLDTSIEPTKSPISPSNNSPGTLLKQKLDELDIHQMTPLQALNLLAELKDLVKSFEVNEPSPAIETINGTKMYKS